MPRPRRSCRHGPDRVGRVGIRLGAAWLGLAVALLADTWSLAGDSFVRRSTGDGDRVLLEVASRSYRARDAGPVVSLVGAVHIGDPAYYAALQRLLDDHAMVLYESVAPRGVERFLRRRDADPVVRTRDSMLYLRRMMLLARELEMASAHQEVPGARPSASGESAAASPAASGTADGADAAGVESAPPRASRPSTPSPQRTLELATRIDSRARPWVEAAMVDAWGGVIEFEPADDGSFLLVSRGADGRPGGEGADADIRLRTPTDRRVAGAAAEEGLQGSLARALGLAFQLAALDYSRPSWELADMSEREFLESLGESGQGASPVVRTLTGVGTTAELARAALGLLRLADGLSGGRLREMIKLMLIEVLASSSERMLARGLSSELLEVILNRRNDVALAELHERLSRPAPPDSIAIFYGAAHMPDLERRLLADGWRRISEEWLPAMSASPAAAGLGDAQERWIRELFQEAMREAGPDERPVPAARRERPGVSTGGGREAR